MGRDLTAAIEIGAAIIAATVLATVGAMVIIAHHVAVYGLRR